MQTTFAKIWHPTTFPRDKSLLIQTDSLTIYWSKLNHSKLFRLPNSNISSQAYSTRYSLGEQRESLFSVKKRMSRILSRAPAISSLLREVWKHKNKQKVVLSLIFGICFIILAYRLFGWRFPHVENVITHAHSSFPNAEGCPYAFKEYLLAKVCENKLFLNLIWTPETDADHTDAHKMKLV